MGVAFMKGQSEEKVFKRVWWCYQRLSSAWRSCLGWVLNGVLGSSGWPRAGHMSLKPVLPALQWIQSSNFQVNFMVCEGQWYSFNITILNRYKQAFLFPWNLHAQSHTRKLIISHKSIFRPTSISSRLHLISNKTHSSVLISFDLL